MQVSIEIHKFSCMWSTMEACKAFLARSRSTPHRSSSAAKCLVHETNVGLLAGVGAQLDRGRCHTFGTPNVWRQPNAVSTRRSLVVAKCGYEPNTPVNYECLLGTALTAAYAEDGGVIPNTLAGVIF